ncbi:MAG: NADH:flavin oxidoreductase [Candidatus Gastranaerophilales bacterium]|nr:NADH:flavin oxidoreductase [Candidatus Gastranaerophilales bacterium]
MAISDKIIRSATLENMADENGIINVAKLFDLYKNISAKTIITGFVYVSENGHAMQELQAGIVNDEQEFAWKELVSKLKNERKDLTFLMQIAHTGRQTTRGNAVGASSVKCSYFRNKVKTLSKEEVEEIIDNFKEAAIRAQRAGFDGVQIHAAHGYLIHQFLSPYTNNRKDKYANESLFLQEIVNSVRSACGEDFKIWLKISYADDRGLTLDKTIKYLKTIEGRVDAVEISYGTMEYALNIIRGNCPADNVLDINPLFNKYPKWVLALWKIFFAPSYIKKFKPFTYNYNYDAALKIKKEIKIPVFLIGGIRKLEDMENIFKSGIDGVCLCRPFICEPDLVEKINEGLWKKSKCTNCNLCTVYCDTKNSIKCYQRKN